MNLTVVAALASVVILGAAAAAKADDVHLLCEGSVTFPEINHGSVFASDGHGRFGSASGYAESRGAMDGEVMVDLIGGQGRIKVPAVMVPALSRGNSDGWWQLSDVTVGDSDIAARFSFNFVDKPSVEISRMSGRIEIKGINKRTFTGECHPYDATTARKF